MQPSEAREALDSIQAADTKLAARIGNCPPWRHAVLGGIFALLIGSIAVSSTVQMLSLPVVLLAVFLTVRSDRKRYGVFVNGYRRGATRPVTFALVAVMIALVLAAMHMRNNGFTDASKVGLAVVAFTLAVMFSVTWHRVLRRELTGA